MALATYEQARPWARAIRHEVLTRRMPKWHAARGYGDFANDPSLSPFEIALIVAWADGGAPKSIVSVLPGLPVLPVLQVQQGPQVQQEVTLGCGEQLLPAGRLMGLRPQLERGESVLVTAALPDGRREILGWFRDFDPEFAPTYWLRVPLDAPSGGRILSTGTTGRCTINVVLSSGF